MKYSQLFKIAPGAITAAMAWLFAATVLMPCMIERATAATSVSQFGFTWTFSADRTVGQYANGDWWVVGPVTITSISPASTTDSTGWTRNGTQLNPDPYTINGGEGFDSSLKNMWSSGLNVAPSFTGSPLVVITGSVVSTISVGQPNVNTSLPQITDAAILTVVASAPASGSFRPPPTGSNKTSVWNKSTLDYSILKQYAPVPNTPDLATVEGYFERPWLCLREGQSIQALTPTNNMPNYGRDIAQRISLGMLSLHLNYTAAQKSLLYMRLVQVGIDVYGSTKAGMVWKGAGGENAGRKAPMVLAGLALHDPSILEWSNAALHFVFQEDQQTWFVTQSDVGRVMYTADGRPRDTYTQSMVGLPEWGSYHLQYPNNDASNWATAYYRWIGGAWLGNILAIKLIPGGETAWNWAPVFAYANRYWSIEGANGQTNQSWGPPNNISPFVYEMWAAYAGAPPSPISTPRVVTFAIGDRIATLGVTNVRATGALSGTLLGTQPQGGLGTIVSGPVLADNFTWWQVDYDTGVDGWSGGDNFIKSTTPPVAPSAPQGLKVVK
ncbi:MAG: hypothetical protein WCO57_00215 [Verrucomicrobiota bacterium]